MAPKRNQFPTWAKKRLLDLGLSVSRLAELIGYARTTTSAALNGSSRFPHVTYAIATHLNHDPKTDGPLPVSAPRLERRVRLVTGS